MRRASPMTHNERPRPLVNHAVKITPCATSWRQHQERTARVCGQTRFSKAGVQGSLKTTEMGLQISANLERCNHPHLGSTSIVTRARCLAATCCSSLVGHASAVARVRCHHGPCAVACSRLTIGTSPAQPRSSKGLLAESVCSVTCRRHLGNCKHPRLVTRNSAYNRRAAPVPRS